MARFKDFGNGGAVASDEPVVFKLHGEEFHCVSNLQGKLLLELVSVSPDDAVASTEMTFKFFDHVLDEESLKRFKELLESKEKVVTLEAITEISSWLIEEYTNRPLPQSEASSTGE
jgi:hypothetical protein